VKKAELQVDKLLKYRYCMRKLALLLSLFFLCLAGAGFFGARWLHPLSWTLSISPVATAQAAESTTARPARALHGLVRVSDPSLVVDLRYATTRNFTGQRIYPREACLVLHRHTARQLLAADAEFVTLGYRLKIWDAYRPLSAQRLLWKKYPHGGFVANPRTGSMHNRGAAVDVTLVDAQGRELRMPSAFDEFSPRAASDYRHASRAATRNRELLARIMLKHGFRRIKHEWWHFEDPQLASNPVLDVPFSAFKE
jgi:D-alanyl-D-alanine dipeptidase